MRYTFRCCLWIPVLLLTGTGAAGQIRMPHIFQDNMVLQRDKPVTVWGWAAPREKVTVTLAGNVQRSEADAQGKWKVSLSPLPAGGPYALHIKGSNHLQFTNVLIGDVWVCGGQSNMQWKIRQTDHRETDTSWVKANQVRLFTVHTEMDYQPRDDLKGTGWQELSFENIDEFSAVSFHFGKKLQKETGVPIGLISNNLGATSVETWMSNEALQEFPVFQKEMAPVLSTQKGFEELKADFETLRKTWYNEHYYKGIGIEEKWYLPETDFSAWKPIDLLGNTWESEPDLKDFDGAVWVKTTFDVDKSTLGDSLLLQLLQVDDYDITWINGVKVGETFGNHNHRNYQVPASLLKPQGNVLVVRIFDTGGIGGFTTSPFWMGPLLKGKWVYRKGLKINAAGFPAPVVPNATPFSSPGVLFNANIAPLRNMVIKGVIWYQGESNADRAREYQSLFPAMIRSWRRNWGDEHLPFLFVQLANYMKEQPLPSESTWAELREAQAMALKLPATAMASAIDLGEEGDIHPKNKKDVGNRLALAALESVYHTGVEGTGPVYQSMSIQDDKIIVTFRYMSGGIYTTDKYGYVRGFQIAGSDGKYYWAQAKISNDQVIVYADQVKEPVFVRYAWSDNPGELNLYNKAGLPALPFRTDHLKGITDGKEFQSGPRF